MISVNPSQIWNESQKDLKKYFPIGFHSQKSKKVNGVEMVDFDYGRANQWSDPTFGGVLPKATNTNLRNSTEGVLLNPASSFVGIWLRIFQ